MQRSAAILADWDRTYLKSLGHLGGEHRELRESEILREDGYAFAIGQFGAVSLLRVESQTGALAFRRILRTDAPVLLAFMRWIRRNDLGALLLGEVRHIGKKISSAACAQLTPPAQCSGGGGLPPSLQMQAQVLELDV